MTKLNLHPILDLTLESSHIYMFMLVFLFDDMFTHLLFLYDAIAAHTRIHMKSGCTHVRTFEIRLQHTERRHLRCHGQRTEAA